MVRKQLNSTGKNTIYTEIRKKLGLTQVELAAIFGLSRASVSLFELNRRNLDTTATTVFANMLLQFHELETGRQAGYRSLETRLILNDVYKDKIPEMKAAEKDRRFQIQQLLKEMAVMKETARDAENAIIVYSSSIQQLYENDKAQEIVPGLQLFKQKAYNKLLTCWEPEQAKLQARIEALAGEARALRRFRLTIVREHNPFKKSTRHKKVSGK
jgi:transcriptional regulator with XRE-family HTH domain